MTLSNNIAKVATSISLLSMSAFSAQVLTNHEFLDGMSGWDTEGDGFSVVAGSDINGSHIDINITDGGTNRWDVKFQQLGVSFKQGHEYVLEWGGSRESGKIDIGVGEATSPYTDYMTDYINFTGDYLDHTTDNGGEVTYHHCDADVSGLRLYVDFGGNNANARLAWISLSENVKSCDGGTDPVDPVDPVDPGDALTNPGTGPVSYYGELEAVGNRLKGSRTGKDVQVRGMSLFWSLWGGEYFYNDDAVTALVDEWGIEVIRTAMGVELSGGYVDSPDYQLSLVEDVIESAIENEIYVIVDYHTHHAEQYKTQAIEFFGYIAEKYGHHDNVIFEVYNEPLSISWNTIKSYATSVMAEIRKYSDNLVVVGTPNWSQDVESVLSNKIVDDNVAYVLHFYAGTHGSSLQSKAKQALDGGVALMVTEWGTVNANGDGSVSTASTNSWMTFMDKHKLSWANWSVHNKEEGASAFLPSVNDDGSNFSTSRTASGNYVYSKLQSYKASAEWRKAEVDPTPVIKLHTGNNELEIVDGKMIIPVSNLISDDLSVLNLYSVTGELLEKIEYDMSNNTINADLPVNIQNGVYILNLQIGSESTSYKLNVQ